MNLLLLTACGTAPVDTVPGDTASTDTSTDTSDTAPPGWTSCDGTPVLTTCPDDALTFDTPDARNIQSKDLTWRWSSGCFKSVADPVYLQVPEDAASLTVTVDAGLEGTEMELVQDGAVVPDPFDIEGEVLEEPAFTRNWPLTPDAGSAPGCWAVFPQSVSTTPDTLPGRLDVYVRRGDASVGTLRVVGVVVDEAAMTDQDVADVLAVTAATYAEGGLSLEIAATETMTFRPGERLGITEDRQALLTAWTDPNGTGAIPVFFIDEYDTSGTIGIAGGIPGAPRPGTASSGVTVAVGALWVEANDAPDLDRMGQVVTHELGHQLGLWHTSEREGTRHDLLADTPECADTYDVDENGFVESDECEGAGADYVMFWQSRGYDQTVVSEDQRWIVARAGAVVTP
jgi:hypothetical protein